MVFKPRSETLAKGWEIWRNGTGACAESKEENDTRKTGKEIISTKNETSGEEQGRIHTHRPHQNNRITDPNEPKYLLPLRPRRPNPICHHHSHTQDHPSPRRTHPLFIPPPDPCRTGSGAVPPLFLPAPPLTFPPRAHYPQRKVEQDAGCEEGEKQGGREGGIVRPG
jgi:hypothetical protein